MSVIGSLACTPVAFIMPAILHLLLVADTPLAKILDSILALFGFTLMVYITGYTFMNWS